MKKILLITIFLVPFILNAQIKVSEMTPATVVNDADNFLLIQSGSSKKVAYSVFKYAAPQVATQIGDTMTLFRTEVANQIHDSIPVGLSVTFGTNGQLPFINAGGTDFSYTPNLLWNGINLNVNKGYRNLLLGETAGRITTGTDNIMIGYQSGYNNLLGTGNVFTGIYSGRANTSGNYNVFTGFYSGYTNSTGSGNTFNGVYSGRYNTTGSDNVFSGYYAGHRNTTASNNTFVGSNSGKENITGVRNSFFGSGSGFNNTTGYNNSFSGVYSGYANTTGYNNSFFGYDAGLENSTGIGNTFIGTFAGNDHQTGSYNSFNGSYSGGSNISGDNNTFLGSYSGYNASTGSGNVFLGYKAGLNESGSNRLYITNSETDTLIYGEFDNDSLHINANVTIDGNVYADNLQTITGISGNVSFINSTGDGFSSSNNLNFDGDTLDLTGILRVGSNFEWNDTTFYIESSVSSGNLYIGKESGGNTTTGNDNTFLGYYAGRNNTTGNDNTFLGYYAGLLNSVGTGNIFIGFQSGYNSTTGSKNLFLGKSSGFSCVTGVGNVFLGYQAGYNETGSNKLYIDNSNTSTPLIKGDFLTDELWFNVDTTHNKGHLVVDSNLYVYGRSILEKYETAAYLDPDSTITTAINSTSWTFLGAGSANKFTNIYAEGFALDGDTLYFVQDNNDVRDSIEFNFSAHATTAAASVNRTIFYSIQIKSIGETLYTEQRQITSKMRTQTAGVYYSGPTCTTMPVFLKNGDKIQLVARCATGTATISTQDAKVYLMEE